MAFNPTEEQEKIKGALDSALVALTTAKTAVNLAIDAGAGCGKTSTLIYLMGFIPSTISYVSLAFNKKIQKEIEERMRVIGTHGISKTINALAYSDTLSHYHCKYNDVQMDMNGYKYLAIALHLSDIRLPAERGKSDRYEFARKLSKLWDMIMVNTTLDTASRRDTLVFLGGDADDASRFLKPDDPLVPQLVADRYGIYLEYDEDDDTVLEHDTALMYELIPEMKRIGWLAMDNPAEAMTLLKSRGNELVMKKLPFEESSRWMTFNDQVYRCVVERWSTNKFKLIMVDEAQDLSPMDRALIERHRDNPGMIIIVGDEIQAIYAFRGADNEGFRNSMRFWKIATPLSILKSFRVPKIIASMAQQYKPGFTAADTNVEGVVGDINADDLSIIAKPGTYCISRTRAAMIPIWNQLIRAGIPCAIVGRDMSDAIITLIEKVSEGDFDSLSKRLRDYMDNRVERMYKQDRSDEDVFNFRDQCDTALEVIDMFPDLTNAKDLCEHIRRMLDPKNMNENGVLIMTGHASKGLEAYTVINVTPEMFGTGCWPNMSQAQLEQEYHLDYVQMTRTKGGAGAEQGRYFKYYPEGKSFFEPKEEQPQLAAVAEKPLPAAVKPILPLNPQPDTKSAQLPAAASIQSPTSQVAPVSAICAPFTPKPTSPTRPKTKTQQETISLIQDIANYKFALGLSAEREHIKKLMERAQSLLETLEEDE